MVSNQGTTASVDNRANNAAPTRPGLVRKLTRSLSNGCAELVRQTSQRSLFSNSSTGHTYQLGSESDSEVDDSEAEFLADLKMAASKTIQDSDSSTSSSDEDDPLPQEKPRLAAVSTPGPKSRPTLLTQPRRSPRSAIVSEASFHSRRGKSNSDSSDDDDDDDDDDDMFEVIGMVIKERQNEEKPSPSSKKSRASSSKDSRQKTQDRPKRKGRDQKLVRKASSSDGSVSSGIKALRKPSISLESTLPETKSQVNSSSGSDSVRNSEHDPFSARGDIIQVNGTLVNKKKTSRSSKTVSDGAAFLASAGPGVVRGVAKSLSSSADVAKCASNGIVRGVAKSLSSSADCARSFFSSGSSHSYQLNSELESDSESDLDDVDEFADDDDEVAAAGVEKKPEKSNSNPKLGDKVDDEPSDMKSSPSASNKRRDVPRRGLSRASSSRQLPKKKEPNDPLKAESLHLASKKKSDLARPGLSRASSIRQLSRKSEISDPLKSASSHGTSGRKSDLPRRGLSRTCSARQLPTSGEKCDQLRPGLSRTSSSRQLSRKKDSLKIDSSPSSQAADRTSRGHMENFKAIHELPDEPHPTGVCKTLRIETKRPCLLIKRKDSDKYMQLNISNHEIDPEEARKNFEASFSSLAFMAGTKNGFDH